jgi:TonB family protein
LNVIAMAARSRAHLAVLTLAMAMAGIAGCNDEDAVIEEPQLVVDESPFRYPVAMWDEGVEGETVIMVRVTEKGGVDSVYVLESSGQAAFDSAAVVGGRDLRFRPGKRDDRTVTMWAKVPVRFQMNETGSQTGATP